MGHLPDLFDRRNKMRLPENRKIRGQAHFFAVFTPVLC